MREEGFGEAGAGTTTGYAEGGEHWRHEALSAAVRDEDLALFLWTWEEQHGDPIELAQRLGLMATRNAQGGLYKQ